MSRGMAAAAAFVLAGCWSTPAPPEPPPSTPAGRRAAAAEAPAEEGEDEEPGRPGKWRKLRPAGRADLTEAQRAEIAELEAIGYADGTQAVEAGKAITVYDRAKAQPGWNLYNSGHASAAYIADMDGTVLHSWSTTWADVFPQSPLAVGTPGTNHWRRVKLLPDGGLLVIWEGRAMARLDRESKVSWKQSNNAHHDLAMLSPDRFVVLTRKAELLPSFSPDRPVLQDFAEVRTLDGELVSRMSLLVALLDSPFAPLLDGKEKRGDLFHTNSVEVLDGSLAAKNPAFTKGRWLVSMRNLDAIGVIDPVTERFVWAQRGVYKKQHDANVVDGGIALFDNAGLGRFSRGLILAPDTLAVVWRWEGSPQRPFVSSTLGTIQQLANRDILLTESDGGRAIEVTPEGEVVWEMYNPHRAGDHGELIAALFEVVRLDPREVPWLKP